MEANDGALVKPAPGTKVAVVKDSPDGALGGVLGWEFEVKQHKKNLKIQHRSPGGSVLTFWLLWPRDAALVEPVNADWTPDPGKREITDG